MLMKFADVSKLGEVVNTNEARKKILEVLKKWKHAEEKTKMKTN